MNNLEKLDEMKEISLIELAQEIFKFTFKYKKIIGVTVIVGALIGGSVGLKLDRDNGYYRQEITFDDQNISQGKNLDGTKFNPNFLIKGMEKLTVSGAYPTYVLTTQKGVQSDDIKKKLEKIIVKNKKEYIEKYLPLDKFNKKFDEKQQNGIKKLEYKEFYYLLIWYVNFFNGEFSKSKIYFNPGAEYRDTEKRVNENLMKYKTEIDKMNFFKNSESAKKYYEARIENIEKSKKIKEERFSSLDFVLGTLGEKNIKIEPKAEIIKGLTYEKAVSEYAQLLWGIDSDKKSITKLKEEYAKISFPSRVLASQLEKLEDDILKDVEFLVKEANPLMEKIIKDEKRENLIKETPVVLVREKKFEILVALGIVFGGILGFLIGGYKELVIFKKKNQ